MMPKEERIEKRREQQRRYWKGHKDEINRKRRAKYAHQKQKTETEGKTEGSDSGLHRPIL